MMRRWTGPDLIIGVALVVLIVSLFLPWYTSTARLRGFSGVVRGTADGTQAHSYMWAAFALAILGLLVVIGRDAVYRIPGNLPSAGQILVGVSLAVLVLSVVAAASKPVVPLYLGGSGSQGPFVLIRFAFGWSYGGFVAIAAALVAVITAFITSGPVQEASRAANAVGRATG